MPQFERDIRDFRATLRERLEENIATIYRRELRCDYIYPETRGGACDEHPCGSPDVLRECIACGQKLCRRHVNVCCDQIFCEYDLEAHQTEDGHIPYSELVA